MSQARVIGGVFGLEPTRPGARPLPPFLEAPCVLLVNGRSAFRLLVEQWRPRRLWLPSYVCPDLPTALESTPTEIAYYPIDEQLQLDGQGWIESIAATDMVVVIDYFGFPTPASVLRRIRQTGAAVIEDACQALLTQGVGIEADAVVFSPRKFVGVPDGGILKISSSRPWTDPVLQPPPPAWWLNAFEACAQRSEFDRHGGNRQWFPRFQEAERMQPVGFYRMSDLTLAILRCAVEFDAVSQRRRENYAVLLETLRPWALRPELPPEVVPLGFPMVCDSRDEVRQRLFEADIYPPIHWALGTRIPAHFEGSHRLSARVLTLPCDQRYDADTMQRMASLVRASL